MALDLSPLDEATLPPSVRRVVAAGAPPGAQMMAARGMAPLPPIEQLLVLYQLSRPVADGAPSAVREAAEKSAGELPDSVLAGALAQPLDGRVIGFFALRLLSRKKLLETVLLNRATTDETFAEVAAATREESVLEMITQNEERLLRHPQIIAALYKNAKTRLSSAIRAVELAVRNNVRVDGVPAFEELTAAIRADAEAGVTVSDDAFQAAVAQTVDATTSLAAAVLAAPVGEDGEALVADVLPDEDKAIAIKDLPNAAKVRLAALGNAFTRNILIRDKSRVVAMAVIRSPSLTDTEVCRFAANRELHEDIIRYVANNREWVRLYPVKLALVNNPKAPLPQALRLIPHLMPKDLRSLSRSKGVPSALAKAAQGLIMTRKG